MNKQKNVIITGGASGIGKATMELFLKKGHNVIIIDINTQPILELKNKHSNLIKIIQADVSNYDELSDKFDEIGYIWSNIDILINNAGISIRHQSFYEIDPKIWKKVLDVNLNGVFYMSKLAIKLMNNSGSIINMASINALAGFPHYADYNASKAGIIALTKTMAIELAPKGIRVNAICPGAVLTPMQEAEYTEDMFQKVNENIPLKRHANPEEIANLFYFLASEDSSFITGHYHVIDGGEMARAIL
jgi:meso-butanediol dehydrogenase / (S,S)-butanediol dehydrogenase / diacetyl reductase